MSNSARRKRSMAAGFIALATATALAACGSSSSSSPGSDSGKQTEVSIGVYAGNLLSAEVAQARGYFTKRHLKVQLKTLGAGPAIVAAVESGSVDVGVGDTLAWAGAVSNRFTDLDVFQIASNITSTTQNDEVFIARKGITSISQLAGKTIGYIPFPELTVSTQLWLKQHGVDPSTVKFVTITDGTQVTLLKTGGADAVISRNLAETQQILTDSGGTDLGQDYAGVQPDHTANVVYFAKKQWLSKDPAVTNNVIAALREGQDYIRTAPAQKLADISDQYASTDFAKLVKTVPDIVDKSSWYRGTQTVFTPAVISATNKWIQEAVEQGAVKKSVDLSTYLWPAAKKTNLGG